MKETEFLINQKKERFCDNYECSSSDPYQQCLHTDSCRTTICEQNYCENENLIGQKTQEFDYKFYQIYDIFNIVKVMNTDFTIFSDYTYILENMRDEKTPVNNETKRTGMGHMKKGNKTENKLKTSVSNVSTQNKDLVKEPDLSNYCNRLCTFAKWPMDTAAGCFYLHEGTSVKYSRVVSLKKEKGMRAVVKVSTQNKDLVNEIVRSFFEQNNPAPSRTSRSEDNLDISYTEKDGIYSVNLPNPAFIGQEPDLSNYCNRLCTFAKWPMEATVSAIKLAAAGFFYLQEGTSVKCFDCQLVISNWSSKHIPREHHIEMSPMCIFINSNKSESATGGSEHLLDFPALNKEIDGIANSETQENVKEHSTTFHAAVNVENTNIKSLAASSDNEVEEDTPKERQNAEFNGRDTQTHVAASQRGLPINQPVDVTSLQTDIASNQNVSDSSIPRERSENNENIYESDYRQLEYQHFENAKYPQYANPRRRLETYSNWLYHNVQDPHRLVEAGFYYTDSTDVVRCFHCDIGLAEWAVEDDPWVEHARHSPQCFFLREKRGLEFIENIQQSWREIYTPKSPQFEDFNIRLFTYQGWPSDRDQSPRDLAAAGFYYTGVDDTVRCHYCDGGLRQWERGDNPWVEHARWFPFCKYVVKMKGLPFIEEVARTYNDLYVNNTQNQLPSAGAFETFDMNDECENENTMSDKGRNALTTAASVSLLEMGYSKNTLIMAINKCLKKTGKRDFTAEDLLAVIQNTNKDDLPKDGNEIDNISSKMSEIGLDHQDMARVNAEQLNNDELRQVNRQIRDAVFLCKICKVKDRNMLLLPCGHRESCEECAKEIVICITCGDFINKKIKTFLS